MAPDRVHEVACLRLRGEVRVDNNGGFVQMALDVPDSVDAAQYAGLELALFGNGARYNVHLRTRDLHLPWQSYRSPVVAEPRWQTLRLPFEGFAAYRTATALDPAKLRSIGLVAIGRPLHADVCLGAVRLYDRN